VALPAAAGAREASQGAARPVTAVRLLVDGRPATDPSLLELVAVPTGKPLSPVAVRESIVHLMALGLFGDVQARLEDEAGGSIVTFEATSARKVTQIVFRGDLGLPAGELRAAVIERYTSTPPIARGSDIARMLETLCRDHGFRRAQVAERVEPDPQPDRATLAFEVKAGPRVKAGALSVTGDGALSASAVLERCGLQPGQPFDPVTVRRKASDLVDSFRAKGYFEATAVPNFDYADDGATADVAIAVNRGPLVTLEFTGDALSPSRQAELVPAQREGSVDEDLLEDGQRNIENFFRAQGYRDARVSYERQPAGNERLKIVFDVKRGPQYRIGSLDFDGNQSVPTADLRAGLRSQPGAVYVKSQLIADIAAVTERYRRVGFTSVKVTPVEQPEVRPETPAQASINIRLEIVEGPRSLIASVTCSGNTHIESPELVSLIQEAAGRPYYAPEVERDRQAILVAYLNKGYETATVEPRAAFSDNREKVDLTFVVHEGPQVLVDYVLIVGNVRTKRDTIQRELAIKQGQPLSASLLVETQQRLIALGLFRRVTVTELQHGSETSRDVLVSVEEAPATTFSYGGGLEGSRRLVREGPGGNETVTRFEFAPRGFFDVGRRNLWGKNRTINFFARVSVRPTDPAPVSSDPNAVWQGGGLGISDYRVQTNYREPRVLSERTDLTITALAEQGYRTSFNYTRQLGRAELLRRFGRSVTVSGSFSVENNHLFDERFNQQDALLIDRAFPQVLFSILGSTLARDKRDDALDPTRGSLTSVDGQLASRFLGSEVGFVKVFAQGFVFHRLPGSKRLVLAGGARIGLATGFATQTPVLDAAGNPIIGPDGNPLTVTSTNIPASERFYAGGDTTVRGFTRDQLGMPNTIDSDGFPHGGMGMLIFNGELRFPLWKWVGAVAFVDVGNVFFQVSDIRLGDLRPALGGGLRLRLPVLPLIRLDVGYNPYPRTFGNGSREKSYAVYFGIGQAF
jgi:outer membrane protein assembly complex protein YaeT